MIIPLPTAKVKYKRPNGLFYARKHELCVIKNKKGNLFIGRSRDSTSSAYDAICEHCARAFKKFKKEDMFCSFMCYELYTYSQTRG